MNNKLNFIELIVNAFSKVLDTVKKTGVKWTLAGIMFFLVFLGGVRVCTSDMIPKMIEKSVENAMAKRDYDKAIEEKNFIIVQQTKVIKIRRILDELTDNNLCSHASIHVFHNGTKSLNNKIHFRYCQLFAESSNNEYKVRDVTDLESTTLLTYYSWLVDEPTHVFNGTIEEFKLVDVEMYHRMKATGVEHVYMELVYDSDGIMFYIFACTWDSNFKNIDINSVKHYRNAINSIMQN